MAYQFKLQVPISKELNEKLKVKVAEVGLNSVNDIVRMFLHDFVNGKLGLSFVPLQPELMLAEGEELDKLIEAAHRDYEQGKTKTLDLSKSIHEQLMSD
ncbi:MAG: hypothetical protein HOA17_01170 [Candidatus Melainabacteria bacterium]|jgi:hypothetical protein|nr:hypothetical protein [Candidatus Melainabacteria bacterium]